MADLLGFLNNDYESLLLISGSEAGFSHVIVGSNPTAFEAQLQVVFDDLSLRRAGPSSSSYSKDPQQIL